MYDQTGGLPDISKILTDEYLEKSALAVRLQSDELEIEVDSVLAMLADIYDKNVSEVMKVFSLLAIAVGSYIKTGNMPVVIYDTGYMDDLIVAAADVALDNSERSWNHLGNLARTKYAALVQQKIDEWS